MLLIKIIDLAGLVLGFCLIAWAGWSYHIPMLVAGLFILIGRTVVMLIARHRYGYNYSIFWQLLDAIACRWPF